VVPPVPTEGLPAKETFDVDPPADELDFFLSSSPPHPVGNSNALAVTAIEDVRTNLEVLKGVMLSS